MSFLAPVLVTSECCHHHDSHIASVEFKSSQSVFLSSISDESVFNIEEKMNDHDNHHKSSTSHHHTCCNQVMSLQNSFSFDLLATTPIVLKKSYFSVKSPVLDGPFQPPKNS